MALLTTGQMASVVFKPTTNSAWAALSPIPGTGYSNALTDAVVNGTALIIYVTDAASGTFTYIGGSGYGYDDTLLVSASTVLFTMYTFTANDATSIVFGKGGGFVYTVDPASGFIHDYPVGASGGLKSFL